MRRMQHAVLLVLCLHLTACASLSNMFDWTHSEKVMTEGHLVIVTEPETLEQWHALINSDKARAAGLTILEVDQNYVSAYDESDDTITLVALEHYTPELCTHAETAESSGRIYTELDSNDITVTEVDPLLVENCKNGQKTFVGMVANDGVELGGAHATLRFEVRHETTRKYKYRWIGARCRDGWISSSTGRGTCSWHGGIAAPAYGKEYVDADEE